jgi:hypothetical protein
VRTFDTTRMLVQHTGGSASTVITHPAVNVTTDCGCCGLRPVEFDELDFCNQAAAHGNDEAGAKGFADLYRE